MEGSAYRPMLASPHDSVPHDGVPHDGVSHDPGWTYELKLDGYRALAYIRDGACTLRSRSDNDLTGRFPEAARALVAAVGGAAAVIDGEVCRVDAAGRTSFSALQQGTGALVYFAFDLLELAGEPLLDLPLRERKERLRALLDPAVSGVSFSEGFDDGDALFEVAQAQRYEGIVAKRLDSPYRPGRRTREWLKVKTENVDEFVVAGYTRGEGRRADGFGALVLGVVGPDGLRYVGNVGSGFDDAEIDRLLRRLAPLERSGPPFAEAPKMARVRKGDVRWVEPVLVAQVRYGEWTHDGRLRQPVFLGLRDDKNARDVTSP